MKKRITGRPPRVADIKKAHALSRKGLSIRQISKLVLGSDRNKTTIARWMKIPYTKVIHM
jgi:hypothetical protein